MFSALPDCERRRIYTTLECAAIGNFPSTSAVRARQSCRYCSMNNVIQVYSYSSTCQILKIDLLENLLKPVGRESKLSLPLKIPEHPSVSHSTQLRESEKLALTAIAAQLGSMTILL